MTNDYSRSVEAARTIADDQFALAEALLADIPPRSKGAQPSGTLTIDDALAEVAAAILEETGVDYATTTLRQMRNVAAWARGDRGPRSPISWAPTTWRAHREAFKGGIPWDEFMLGKRAEPVGRNMTPERRETLKEAGVKAGLATGAKVADVASNPKALAVAIEHDEATAQAAEAALDRRKTAEFKQAVHKAGGNPDLPLDAPGNALGIEMALIEAKVNVLLSDAEKVMGRAEEDQQPPLRELWERSAKRVTALAFGKVPDSLEGIER